MPLYFIFLKTMMLFLALASIISILLINFNFQVFSNSKYGDLKGTNRSFIDSVANALVGSTLAAANSKHTMTFEFSLKERKVRKLELACESGHLLINHNYTQFGLIDSARSSHEVNNVFDISCTNWNGFVYSIQHCQGKQSCSVLYQPFWLVPRCQNEQIFDSKIGYIKIFCEDAKAIRTANLSVTEFYHTYFVFCTALLAIFQVFLGWLLLNQKYFLKQYTARFRTPSEYTLQLRGLPSQWNEDEMLTGVYKMFSKLGKKYKFAGNPLIDAQIAHSKKVLILTNKGEEIKQKIQLIMIKIKNSLKMSLLPTSHMKVDEFQKKLTTAVVFADIEAKKRIKSQFKLLGKIKILNERMKKVKAELFKVSSESDNIKSMFVTFQRIKDKQFFQALLVRGWKHFLKQLNCFAEGDLTRVTLDQEKIYAEEPPQPININWENYSHSTKDKIERRFCSWTLYIILYLLRKHKSRGKT